jgi:hypothetical protein
MQVPCKDFLSYALNFGNSDGFHISSVRILDQYVGYISSCRSTRTVSDPSIQLIFFFSSSIIN